MSSIHYTAQKVAFTVTGKVGEEEKQEQEQVSNLMRDLNQNSEIIRTHNYVLTKPLPNTLKNDTTWKNVLKKANEINKKEKKSNSKISETLNNGTIQSVTLAIRLVLNSEKTTSEEKKAAFEIYGKHVKPKLAEQEHINNISELMSELNLNKESINKYKVVLICPHNLINDSTWNDILKKAKKINEDKIQSPQVSKTLNDGTVQTVTLAIRLVLNSEQTTHKEKEEALDLFNKIRPELQKGKIENLPLPFPPIEMVGTSTAHEIPKYQPPTQEYSPVEYSEESEEKIHKKLFEKGELAGKNISSMYDANSSDQHKYNIGYSWVDELDFLLSGVDKEINNLYEEEKKNAFKKGFLKHFNLSKTNNIENDFANSINNLKELHSSVKRMLISMDSFSDFLKTIDINSPQTFEDNYLFVKNQFDELNKLHSKKHSHIVKRLINSRIYEGELEDYGSKEISIKSKKGKVEKYKVDNYINILYYIATDKNFLDKKNKFLKDLSTWMPSQELASLYPNLSNQNLYLVFNTLDLRTQNAILNKMYGDNKGEKWSRDSIASFIISCQNMPETYAPLFVSDFSEKILNHFETKDIPKIVTYIGSHMNTFHNTRDFNGMNEYMTALNNKIDTITNAWSTFRIYHERMKDPKTARIGSPGGLPFEGLGEQAVSISVNRLITNFNLGRITDGSRRKMNTVQNKFPNLFGETYSLLDVQQAYVENFSGIVEMGVVNKSGHTKVYNFDLDLYTLAPDSPPKVPPNYYYNFEGKVQGGYEDINEDKFEEYEGGGGIKLKGGVGGHGSKQDYDLSYEGKKYTTHITRGDLLDKSTHISHEEHAAKGLAELENVALGEEGKAGVITSGTVYFDVTSDEFSDKTSRSGIVSSGKLEETRKGYLKEKSPDFSIKPYESKKFGTSLEDAVGVSFDHIAPEGALTAFVFDTEGLSKQVLDENNEIKKDVEFRNLNIEVFHKRDNMWVYAGSYEIVPEQVEQLYSAWHQTFGSTSTEVIGAGTLFFDKNLFEVDDSSFQGFGGMAEHKFGTKAAGGGAGFEYKQEGPHKGIIVGSFTQDSSTEIHAGVIYINPEFASFYKSENLNDIFSNTREFKERTKKMIGTRPSMSLEEFIGEKAEKGAAFEYTYAKSAERYGVGYVSATFDSIRAGAHASLATKNSGHFNFTGAGVYGRSEKTKDKGFAVEGFWKSNDEAVLASGSAIGQWFKDSDYEINQTAGLRWYFDLWGSHHNIKLAEVFDRVSDGDYILAGVELVRENLGPLSNIRVVYANESTLKENEEDVINHLISISTLVNTWYLEGVMGISKEGGLGGYGKLVHFGNVVSEAFLGGLDLSGWTAGVDLFFNLGTTHLNFIPFSISGKFKDGTFKTERIFMESSIVGRTYLQYGHLTYGLGYLHQKEKDEELKKFSNEAHQLSAMIGGGQRLSSSALIDAWNISGEFGWRRVLLRDSESSDRLFLKVITNLDINLYTTLEIYTGVDYMYRGAVDPKKEKSIFDFDGGVNLKFRW